MSAAISISNFALQPSSAASKWLKTDKCLDTVVGKLFSAAQAVTSAVAIPVILAVGLLESLLRACMCEDLAVVKASLKGTGELALFHLCNIIPSLFISTIGTSAESREMIANSLIKAAGIGLAMQLNIHLLSKLRA